MKTLAELKEAVLKLRGFNNDDRGKGFMKELHATSKEHPINPKVRVIGDASVHVSSGFDGIHLHDISSHKPKSGAGTKALKHLTSLADKHNVPISGHASAYSKEDGHIKSDSGLKKWYKKHGFETKDSGKIHYKPKD
jgi:hypothetical protein